MLASEPGFNNPSIQFSSSSSSQNAQEGIQQAFGDILDNARESSHYALEVAKSLVQLHSHCGKRSLNATVKGWSQKKARQYLKLGQVLDKAIADCKLVALEKIVEDYWGIFQGYFFSTLHPQLQEC